MCSQSLTPKPPKNISFPRSKLDLLFAEARATGCPLTTLAAIATVLGLRSQASLTPVFGHQVNNEIGSNPRRYLVAIAAAYNRHGIAIEVEWFDTDMDGFKQHLAGMRKARHAPIHDLDPTPSTKEWHVSDPVHLSQGIAEIRIHPPLPSNNPNSFPLRVSLSLARHPDEIDDIPLWIGLRNAWIVPGFNNCQASEWHKHDNTKQRANLIDIQGPREGAVLDGTVMEHHTLATLEYTTGAQPAVALELRSRKVDLEVVPEDPSAIPINRQKVLQRFLAECTVAEEDRQVTWSRARITRRNDDEADA